jgi:hypothetical protein
MIITGASQAESVTGRDVGTLSISSGDALLLPGYPKQRPVGEPDKQVHLLTQQLDFF